MREVQRKLRMAFRQLFRSPGFTATAVLLLALGVGVNGTIFKLIHTVLINPVPVAEPESLVESGSRISYPDFQELRDQTQAFSDVAVFETTRLQYRKGAGGTQMILGGLASANLLEVLGVDPPLGRGFVPEDNDSGTGGGVVLLSHDFWSRALGAAPEILGETIYLNGQQFSVVGVLPRGFRGLHLDEPVDVWLPIVAQPRVATGFLVGLDLLQDRSSRWLRFVGRLDESASLQRAQTEIDVLTRRWEQDRGLEEDKLATQLVSLETAAGGVENREAMVRFLGLLAGIVGVVYLITCTNLANLLLVRALGRTRELAVRFALGSSRGQALRMLLMETLLLAILGAVLAVVVAGWTLRALAAFELPGQVPIEALGLGLDLQLALFVLGLALLAAVLCGGLASFYLLRAGAGARLTSQRGDSEAPGSARLRSGLLALQIALSLPLLIAAGLLLRSVQSAMSTDLGFETENLVVAPINLGILDYEKPQARQFYEELQSRLRSLPETSSVSSVMRLPMGTSHWRVFPELEGYVPAADERVEAHPNIVGAEYFETLEIPVVEGRTLEATDREGSFQATVINETMAKRYWPNESPLGKRITPFPGQMDLDLEVVGVVADVRSEGFRDPSVPTFYVPYAQDLGLLRVLSTVHVVVRAQSEPEALVASLQNQVQNIDRNLPHVEAWSFEELLSRLLLPQHFGLRLLSFLGVLALLLSCVGLYGAVEIVARSRTNELGIRMALGARRNQVVKLVLGQMALPVSVGLLAGIVIALLSTRFLEAFLYDVTSTDPMTFVMVSLGLLAVAFGASYLPARRAGRIDPSVALRVSV